MSIAIPQHVLLACKKLAEQGFQAYVVGGAVRDSLLNSTPGDWDLTTDALPEEIESIFEKSLPTGKEFGTITVLINSKSLEITTMRSDGPYSDSRRPDHITFTNNLKSDLSRRDFTINAIAYDPLNKNLIDPFFGVRHLKKKLLVTVGDPRERFLEDPLRMLRLIRFQAILGFRIERKTEKTLPGLAQSIDKVSPERILTELNKMLLGKKLRPALITMYKCGLMQVILPELVAGLNVSPGKNHPYNLLGHLISSAHYAYPNLALRWAALLHDVGKVETLGRNHAKISARMARDILCRLRASNKLIHKVTHLITHHMFSVHPHSRDKTLRKFMAQIGTENAYDLIKLRQADMAGMNCDPRQIIAFGQAMKERFDAILAEDSALTLHDLAVDGHLLMDALQLKPSPLLGETLQFLLEQVWEKPQLNQSEVLIDLARDYLMSRQKTSH